MSIITISREFGSGGRELGKRMADVLGWDYYDREIIDRIAQEQGLDSEYVQTVLEKHEWRSVPISYRRSFMVTGKQDTSLLVQEKKLIERIAATGNPSIIVGRNADVFLRGQNTFSIFVCAEQAAKLQRCRERDTQGYSDWEIERQMKRIDKARAATRELVAGNTWGKRDSYHLTVNTTGWDLKILAPVVAEYAKQWFAR